MTGDGSPVPAQSPVPVVYVGGTGRSGSTVVANALGSAPGAVSVGELRFLWERGVTEDRLCGCGEPFSRCGFWQQVLDLAYPDGRPDAAQVHRKVTAATRLRTLPGALGLPGLAGRDAEHRELAEELTAVLTPLYQAVRTVSGADVVIDSSKLPTYAVLLASMPALDVRVVHLVRDPRAAAFSWTRTKEQPDRRRPGHMERRGVVKSTVLWSVWNAALERAWRARPQDYHRRTYEQLVAAPRRELVALGRDLGLELDELFLDEQSMQLATSHTVAGNPARLRSGPTRLRLDDEWTHAMPVRDRQVVSALAAPLAHRYGYPVHLRGDR